MSASKRLEDILMGRRPLPTAGGEARRLIQAVKDEGAREERVCIYNQISTQAAIMNSHCFASSSPGRYVIARDLLEGLAKKVENK